MRPSAFLLCQISTVASLETGFANILEGIHVNIHNTWSTSPVPVFSIVLAACMMRTHTILHFRIVEIVLSFILPRTKRKCYEDLLSSRTLKFSGLHVGLAQRYCLGRRPAGDREHDLPHEYTRDGDRAHEHRSPRENIFQISACDLDNFHGRLNDMITGILL